MDTLWVFDASTEELRQRLAELQAAADGHARHLLQLMEEELAERDSHAAFEGLILPLLQDEEALQELEQLHLASPQAHQQAADQIPTQQHSSSHSNMHLCCETEQPACQQTVLGSSASSPSSAALTAAAAPSQQLTSPGSPALPQQQQQPQPPTLIAAVPAKPGQAATSLTPLQAAQRAFLEEQQRLHKACAALHRPVLVHGRPVATKQQKTSGMKTAAAAAAAAVKPQRPSDSSRCGQGGVSTEQPSPLKRQQEQATRQPRCHQASGCMQSPHQQHPGTCDVHETRHQVERRQQQQPEQEQQQEQYSLLELQPSLVTCSPAADVAQSVQTSNGTSSSSIASPSASGSSVAANDSGNCYPDATAAQPAATSGIMVAAVAAEDAAAEATCKTAGPAVETAAEQAVEVDTQPLSQPAAVDMVKISTVADNLNPPKHAAAVDSAVAAANGCKGSAQGQPQHGCSELLMLQEQQGLCVEEQSGALRAGGLFKQQQQQQQQPVEEQLGASKVILDQTPAAALLGTSTRLSTEDSAPPSRSVESSSNCSSSYPQAVFNRATGRAGVHQPLQLDSWRDWDAMAGSMDEEGGSGFGAWAGGHDD